MSDKLYQKQGDYISKGDTKAYVTEELKEYSKKDELQGALKQLIGSAPDDLNTIGSIALEIVKIRSAIEKIWEKIPTKTSQLTNDSGFISEINGDIKLNDYYTKDEINDILDFEPENSGENIPEGDV